ncbi:hypothetical protein [Ralstonia holmesii]|nr:hypothetical protein [Ralstonia sp. LMG 32967]
MAEAARFDHVVQIARKPALDHKIDYATALVVSGGAVAKSVAICR